MSKTSTSAPIKSLWGCVGFVFAFGLFFAIYLAYSVNRSSLWLPSAAALCVYFILSLSPNFKGSAARLGVTLLLLGGASFLWIVSDRPLPNPLKTEIDLRQLAHAANVYIFVAFFIAGLLTVFAAMLGKGEKPPRVGAALLLVALGFLVSYFSSSHGGADPMIAWSIKTFSLDRPTAETTVVAIRKTIHFTFYFVVATAGYLMSSMNGGSRLQAIRSGLLSALTFSCYDELRQHSMPNRQGSIWDVALDMAGATTAMLLIGRSAKPKTVRKA